MMNGERITNNDINTYILELEGNQRDSFQYVIDDDDEYFEESTNDGFTGATFLQIMHSHTELRVKIILKVSAAEQATAFIIDCYSNEVHQGLFVISGI